MGEANNVVELFPGAVSIEDDGPRTMDEVNETMKMVKQFHIQETIETVIPMLFDQLMIAGFLQNDDNEIQKHMALIVESVRSLLCHTRGIDHPLQLISNSLFILDENEDSVTISDSVKIIITPNSEGKAE